MELTRTLYIIHFSLLWIWIRILSFISFEFGTFVPLIFFSVYRTFHLFLIPCFILISYNNIPIHIVSLLTFWGPPYKAHIKHLKAHFDYRHFEFFFSSVLVMWSYQNAFTSLRLILPTGICISWIRVCARAHQ